MNKIAQCMVKAAQLRAQASKLEKVALLLDDSDEITGADLGIGAGALGLLGGGAYGINKHMKNRAAAKAAAAAAAAAAQAAAAKAARKSMLLKGALGLGGVGTSGYGLYRAGKHYDIANKLKNWYAGMGTKAPQSLAPMSDLVDTIPKSPIQTYSMSDLVDTIVPTYSTSDLVDTILPTYTMSDLVREIHRNPRF